MVMPRGLEPRIFGLKGRRVSQFHYGTKYPRSNAVVCSFSVFDTIATRRPAHFPDFWNFGMMNLYGALHTRLRPLCDFIYRLTHLAVRYETFFAQAQTILKLSCSTSVLLYLVLLSLPDWFLPVNVVCSWAVDRISILPYLRASAGKLYHILPGRGHHEQVPFMRPP